MFNNINFSDFYKFLASIGLIIIASSLIILWLFMKHDISTMIKSEDYIGLVESSKILTDKKIALNLFVIKVIPWVSGGLIILGITTIFIGLKKWRKKQINLDEAELLTLEELRQKIVVKSLQPSEVAEKIDKEIENEKDDKFQEEPSTTTTSTTTTTTTTPPVEQNEIDKKEKEVLKSNLIEMENLFYQKILDYQSFVYESKLNVKITDKGTVDIFLSSYNNKKYHDIMIEIKYLQNKLDIQQLKKTNHVLIQILNEYIKKTRRQAYYYLIFVYKQDIADEEVINRFKEVVNDLRSRITRGKNRLLLMNDDDAKNFDITKIIN